MLQGKHNDNLGLLLSYLCFQRSLLPALALSLTATTSSAVSINPADGQVGAQQADSNRFDSAATLSSAAMVAASPSLADVVLLQELAHEAQAGLHLDGCNE